ncbi:lipid A export permease/ATP-binding protein MsbA [Algiphilus aromaticivorans]|uniref:lipid A export permease/ATP-binding protein MsbA n=1 Tax=Algiphilus aromaticivorans TaxID=382454 RepID=UPI000694872A|nr:lipid A export permease/ATP-binding protein MsbA [Algiphilus aromaticivorans]
MTYSAILKPIEAGEAYHRLLRYLRPLMLPFVLAIIAMALFAASNVGFIAMMQPLLDESFVAKNRDDVTWIPLAIIGLFLLRASSNFGALYGMAYVGRGVIRDLRQDLFNHLLTLPVMFYDHNSSGQLLTRLTYHVEQVAESITTALTAIIKEGLTVIGLLGLMFYLEWRLTLFTLAVVPFVALIINYVAKRFRKISTRIQGSVGGLNHVAEEVITGQRTMKIYGGEEFERSQFLTANRQNRKLQIKLAATQAMSSGIVQFLASFALAAVVYYATTPGMIESLTPGTFVSYVGAMLSLMNPIKELTRVNERIQRGIAASQEIFGMLEAEPERDDGTLHPTQVDGALRFESVDFRYPGHEELVLQEVELDIPSGSTVAFVGRSGSGKSTLLSLLPRFYDPIGGRILLDGQDLRDYNRRALRSQIAMVDQQVRLFNASIADNIAYGLQPRPDNVTIEAAARDAYAWEFIEKLPDGLETHVGSNGVLLSGGQRQRLAIARALLKNAPLLLLDEATSALDTESERYIQGALARLMEGRTTLVIAHRLSTVRDADQIVAMADGRIMEVGTHEQLLAHGGVYASLYAMQFREEAEGTAAAEAAADA